MIKGVLTQRASSLCENEKRFENLSPPASPDTECETSTDFVFKGVIVFGSMFIVIAALIYVIL